MKNTEKINDGNNKGITLIALIITVILIITLLALIEFIVPDDLFKKADEAEKFTVAVISDAQNEIDGIKGSIPRIDDDEIGSEGENNNNKPIIENVSVSNITATTATITATATDIDGDAITYTLKINGTQYGETKTEASGTAVSWAVTGLVEQTTYAYEIIATDQYNGQDTKTGQFTTTVSNAAPVIVTNALNEKTTTTFTIKMKATDSDGDNLTYELYKSTSQNGTYTKVATSSITEQNVQITLTTTGLTEYTTYWWYITATDGTATTTSDKQSVTTYCPGTGLTCETTTLCTINRTYEDVVCGNILSKTNFRSRML